MQAIILARHREKVLDYSSDSSHELYNLWMMTIRHQNVLTNKKRPKCDKMGIEHTSAQLPVYAQHPVKCTTANTARNHKQSQVV